MMLIMMSGEEEEDEQEGRTEGEAKEMLRQPKNPNLRNLRTPT